LEATRKVHPANGTPVHILLLLLMMVSSVSKKPTPALSQQILDMAVLYFEQFQVKTHFLLLERKTESDIMFTLMPLANIIVNIIFCIFLDACKLLKNLVSLILGIIIARKNVKDERTNRLLKYAV
jgi:hypothetical protein